MSGASKILSGMADMNLLALPGLTLVALFFARFYTALTVLEKEHGGMFWRFSALNASTGSLRDA